MTGALGALKTARTPTLEIGFHESGPPNGDVAILLHGFPYGPQSYQAVAPMLAEQGLRVIVPYLRGFGPSRFLRDHTLRSGEQAALGNDLIELIESLGVHKPILAGFDWGGRAACVVAAVRPDLVRGLVSVGGYNIFGPPPPEPLSPEVEHILWYHYYLQTDRGRRMLEHNRDGFLRYLWRLWSPHWAFTDETFAACAEAFDNPDFVDVVLHSYRHRSHLVEGDATLAALAAALETRPDIEAPTVILHGDADNIPLEMSLDRSRFTNAFYQRHVVARVGHNLPQEAPSVMAGAVAMLRGR